MLLLSNAAPAYVACSGRATSTSPESSTPLFSISGLQNEPKRCRTVSKGSSSDQGGGALATETLRGSFGQTIFVELCAKRPPARRLFNKKRRGPHRVRRSLPHRAGTINTARTPPGAAEAARGPQHAVDAPRALPDTAPEISPAPHAARKHGAAPRPADDDGRV